MAIRERPLVVGIFEDEARAEQAVEDLRADGFTKDQIGFAAHGEDADEGDRPTRHEQRGGTREGLVMGAITGGAFGSIVGAAVAVFLPGVGPVIAGGILGAALTGAAAGAVTGGLVGALREWGLSEEEAHYYQDEFESGRTLVTVKTNDPLRQGAAMVILRRNGGYDAITRPTPNTATTGVAGTTTSTEAVGNTPVSYPTGEGQASRLNGDAIFVPEH